MKIQELRLRNLNSLYGDWVIDFTDPHYISNGIFALTGPTGAGKSTILDAICLALYGRTPRLGNITQSTNEIMSRQSGECMAEVVFESTEGKFRCSWSQGKARKRPDGALQSPRHEISDAVTGKIIEEKKSLVGKVIEEKTGMDFERFTRSILLAQGGFDSFLKADVENKSRILEQITGTSIYSTISKKCHERQRDEREKLTLLEAQFSGITVLTEADEMVLVDQLVQKRETVSAVSTSLEQLQASIRWVQTIAGIEREMVAIEQEFTVLESEKMSFADQKIALDRAQQAVQLEPLFVELSNKRTLLGDTARSLESYQSELVTISSQFVLAEDRLNCAVTESNDAKSARSVQLPVIQKVRELDSELIVQRDRWREIDTELKALEQQEVQASADRHSLRQHADTIDGSLRELVRYRTEMKQDEQLVSQLSAIEQKMNHCEELFDSLNCKEQELVEKQSALDEKRLARESQFTAIGALRESVSAMSVQVESQRSELAQTLAGKSVREYSDRVQMLLREKVLLARIASLEEERQRLVDGAPCPLCGSNHHPFAEGNIPSVDAVDQEVVTLNAVIDRAEQIEKMILQLTTELARRSELVNRAGNELVIVENTIVSLEQQIAEFVQAVATEKVRAYEVRTNLVALLAPFGVGEPHRSVIPQLQSRLEQWNRSIAEIDRLQKEMDRLDSEQKRCDAVIATCAPQIATKKIEREDQANRGRLLKKEREDMFGTENPAEIELKLEKAVEIADRSVSLAQEEYRVRSSTKERISADILRCSDLIAKESPEREKLESEFLQELYRASFIDERAFVRARMTIQDREFLMQRSQDLIRRETELSTRRDDRRSRHTGETAKALTELSETELAVLVEEKKAIYDQVQQETALLELTIRDGVQARELRKKASESIERQRIEFLRWSKLNELIGSADGKKFRTYAQGLTFELMVAHANNELEKMSDRYILTLDKHQPLELNVIDTYQAGEERSVKNLSGGECFIVSLTLALGLSKMASRRVRVDSLFLDEGFGTLDEDSLETALETLSSLNEAGKLIGVISHVSALKERISTQIQVVPISGGKSALVGPGCSRGE